MPHSMLGNVHAEGEMTSQSPHEHDRSRVVHLTEYFLRGSRAFCVSGCPAVNKHACTQTGLALARNANSSQR